MVLNKTTLILALMEPVFKSEDTVNKEAGK